MADTIDEKNVREGAVRILQSVACKKIDFELENVVVSGYSYSLVARALENLPAKPSKVRFTIDPTITAGAQYFPVDEPPIRGKFVFRTAGVANDKGNGHQVVVHESTHAVIDMMSDSGNLKALKITNEMAAYIAGGLYNVLTGNNADDNFPIFREAHAIAEAVIANIKKYKFTGRYSIQASETVALRAAILADSLYGSLKSNPTATYGDDGLL